MFDLETAEFRHGQPPPGAAPAKAPLTAEELRLIDAGILAADETVPTISKRLAARKIDSTPDVRRGYREMFFATPGVAAFISGVILQDETIRQASSKGTPLVSLLSDQGIIPGIKVDEGVVPLAGSPGETITDGLDGLRNRVAGEEG